MQKREKEKETKVNISTFNLTFLLSQKKLTFAFMEAELLMKETQCKGGNRYLTKVLSSINY